MIMFIRGTQSAPRFAGLADCSSGPLSAAPLAPALVLVVWRAAWRASKFASAKANVSAGRDKSCHLLCPRPQPPLRHLPSLSPDARPWHLRPALLDLSRRPSRPANRKLVIMIIAPARHNRPINYSLEPVLATLLARRPVAHVAADPTTTCRRAPRDGRNCQVEQGQRRRRCQQVAGSGEELDPRPWLSLWPTEDGPAAAARTNKTTTCCLANGSLCSAGLKSR